jgi:hypothetical protein
MRTSVDDIDVEVMCYDSNLLTFLIRKIVFHHVIKIRNSFHHHLTMRNHC